MLLNACLPMYFSQMHSSLLEENEREMGGINADRNCTLTCLHMSASPSLCVALLSATQQRWPIITAPNPIETLPIVQGFIKLACLLLLLLEWLLLILTRSAIRIPLINFADKLCHWVLMEFHGYAISCIYADESIMNSFTEMLWRGGSPWFDGSFSVLMTYAKHLPHFCNPIPHPCIIK